MLVAENISYQVEGKNLLNNVSVRFEPGKMNLIIGPNGAGKSTLVKILSGQLKPTTGKVFYANRNVAEISVTELAKFRAVLSQNMELAFSLSVFEVVMMGRYPHFTSAPSVKDAAICKEVMQFLDVLDFENRNYMSLSGGEKQRVHFARVLAQIWETEDSPCRFLLLDEPLAFLDVYYQFDFMNKLLELIKQQNIVITGVVHDLNLAAKYADYLVLMNKGLMVASGRTDVVLTAEHICNVYSLIADIQNTNNTTHIYFQGITVR